MNTEGGDKVSFDYNKLRGRIVEKYGSVASFAEKTRIKYPAVIRKMAGDTAFSQADIIEWCDLLDIDVSEAPLYFLQVSSKS